MSYYVYIMANKPRGTLYIGVTNNITKRTYEHAIGQGSQFTKRYHLKKLIYLEIFDCIEDAILREKKLKNWHRDWKLSLIESVNPHWNDLTALTI